MHGFFCCSVLFLIILGRCTVESTYRNGIIPKRLAELQVLTLSHLFSLKYDSALFCLSILKITPLCKALKLFD